MSDEQLKQDGLEDDGSLVSREPRDYIYMLLFVAFGLWVLFEFIMKSNIFGALALGCGPFLVFGGICYILILPQDLRKLGALVGLVGAGFACYMFFTLSEMIANHLYVYPSANALVALLLSFLCLLISLAQFCKTM